MNKYLVVIAVVFLLIGSIIFLNQPKPEEIKDITAQPSVTTIPAIEKVEVVDFKASFAIFTNGTFRIFTAHMYHNQSEEVFIESSNPNIVRVRKADISWDDFFKTLPFKLDKDCLTTGTGQTFCTGSSGKLRFYINGVEDPIALDKQINKEDQLLVTYGNENEQQIKEQLRKVFEIQ